MYLSRTAILPIATSFLFVITPLAHAGAWDGFLNDVGKMGDAIGEATGKLGESISNMTGQDQAESESQPSPEATAVSLGVRAQPRRVANGPDMRRIQQGLYDRGFDPKGIDGKFGPGTSRAIAAYQKANGMRQTGQPTYDLLTSLSEGGSSGSSLAFIPNPFGPTGAGRPIAPGGAGKEPAVEARGAGIVGQCVGDRFDGDTTGISDRFVESIQAQLSETQQSYLVGLCLPKDLEGLRSAYLYLVATGTTHARMTQEKYLEMIDIYKNSGIDIAVQEDAFRRAVKTLDQDLSSIGEDRIAGIEQLLENYQEAEKASDGLLQQFVRHADSVKAQYKARARSLMSDALSHSASTAFFLARSLYVGKGVAEFIRFDKPESSGLGGLGNLISEVTTNLSENMELATFVATKNDELMEMSKSSVAAVEILTTDHGEIGQLKVSMAKANDDLVQRRKSTDWTLDAFESEFETQQQSAATRV